MDNWGTLHSIPEEIGTVECARYNTPIAVSGPWLVRLPSWSDIACDQNQITRVEVFRLGNWVGADDHAGAPARLMPYPNPAAGPLTITLPAGKGWVLDVIDAAGRCARSLTLSGAGGRVTVDLTGLPPGAFMLSARDQEGTKRLLGTCVVQTP